MSKKKTKVTFLLDKSNNWFHTYIKKTNFGYKNKYIYNIEENHKKIKGQDLVFILGYGRLLSNWFLKKNKLNLVIHESKLPYDRGGAPIHYQVLKNKKKIHICLIEAAGKIDTGDIYLIDKFKLNGDELMPELRERQAHARLNLIKKFLKKYPKIDKKKQKGKGSYNRKRNSNDSEINIKKSIKSQFNLLRICDNERYPAFFKFKNQKYILKIFKV